MPYIKKEKRTKWAGIINDIKLILKNVPEEEVDRDLNYLITSVLLGAYKENYFSYNRAIGMIECVKQEFYRKKVAPYEDKKIKENGDVS